MDSPKTKMLKKAEVVKPMAEVVVEIGTMTVTKAHQVAEEAEVEVEVEIETMTVIKVHQEVVKPTAELK